MRLAIHGGAFDPMQWQRHAWGNRLQSILLLAIMASFLALLGWLLWGGAGVAMLLLLGALGVSLNPTTSPAWVMKLYGARRLGPHEAPGLFGALDLLSRAAGLAATPALYYVPSSVLNAFAVGSPQRSAIALTDGLLRRLERRELLGVLAHEISHVQANDLWVMGLADMFSRTTSLLSLIGQFLLLINLPLLLFTPVTIDWFAIALLIFAPSLSALAQLALSRTREYDADLNAVRLTGDPDGLARALVKIEQIQGGWFERIFLPGRRIPEPSLLRTHPLTDERVARLLSLRRSAAAQRPGDPDLASHLAFGGSVTRPPRWHVSGLWH